MIKICKLFSWYEFTKQHLCLLSVFKLVLYTCINDVELAKGVTGWDEGILVSPSIDSLLCFI